MKISERRDMFNTAMISDDAYLRRLTIAELRELENYATGVLSDANKALAFDQACVVPGPFTDKIKAYAAQVRALSARVKSAHKAGLR